MSRVLLVDEQQLVRVAIKRLLQDEGSTELVAECSSGREAIEQLRHCRPEMVIMDMGIEVLGVFDIVRHMRTIDSQLGIIILTTTLDASLPRRIIKLGVSACLSKSCSAHEFYKAIRAVQAGRHYVSSEVARLIIDGSSRHQAASPFLRLSNRELQIMYMFVRGMDIHEISAKLYLSPKTISTYRYRIFSKVGVRGDVELTHLAMRYGMIESDYILPLTQRKAS